MKQFLILFIILTLRSFTKEEIIIRNGNNNWECYNSLKDFIDGITSVNYYEKYYGFNAQNCNQRNTITKDQTCCYISLKYEDVWYYACVGVEMEKYKGSKFLKNYFDEESKNNQFPANFDYKKDLKVDCFSKNLNIYILLFLIIIFLF